MEQTNLTPEQYKTLALWAGRKFVNITDGMVMASMGEVSWEKYTPDTNDSQAWELEDKLIEKGYELEWDSTSLAVSVVRENREMFESRLKCLSFQQDKPRKLLLCHAVLAIGGEG